MEFNEKLLELRKKKEMTQEELAQALFVSRAAVSKWESGRGYPGIDSLKAMAKFFSVSVDELLSGEELLSAAQEDNRQIKGRYRGLVFGLLDICNALFFLLPVFAQRGETLQAVSLWSLTEVSPWLRGAYIVSVMLCILAGTAALALQNLAHDHWRCWLSKISVIFNVTGVLIYTVSLQPYPAVFLLVLLLIKVLLLIQKP